MFYSLSCGLLLQLKVSKPVSYALYEDSIHKFIVHKQSQCYKCIKKQKLVEFLELYTAYILFQGHQGLQNHEQKFS